MNEKNLIFLLFLCLSIVSVKAQINKDIILENAQFKLVVGSDAVPKSLILKSNNQECLFYDSVVSLFTATQERPYNNEVRLAQLNKRTTYQADSIYQKDGKLVVGFEIIPYSAVISYNITPQYIRLV